MATIPAQQITRQGLVNPTMSAATSGGDAYEPGDRTFLFVKNADAGSHTITIHATATAYGEPIADVAVAIAAGDSAFLGPYPAAMVADESTGLASITYDGVTSVTLAVLTF